MSLNQKLSEYKFSDLKFDVKAAVSLAAVSLPVGVAYAEILGLPAESGIYTTIFSLFCYALIGTSRELIIGPDSIAAALLASSVFAAGISDSGFNSQFIFLTTIVSGILFFAAGFMRLGFIANFLSRPILIGFLNGVAVMLIIGQLTKFSGVPIANSNSIIGAVEFFRGFGNIHYPTLISGIISIVLLIILKKVSKRVPATLTLILISIACGLIFHLEKYGLKFAPEIQSGIPIPVFPDLILFKDHYRTVLIDAAAIVFLTYANTVLTGKSFSKNRKEFDPDKEFYAMGLSDVVCGIFKGFPISASSSRTAVNIDSGSRTKLSMVFSGLIMAAVVIFLPEEFSLIPSVVFAAVIIDSSLGIFNIAGLKEIKHFSREEFVVSLACSAGVLIMGVLDGILVAIVLSFLFLIKNSSIPEEYELVYDPEKDLLLKKIDDNLGLSKENILIYRFNSSMLFYNIDYFRKKLFEKISSRKNLNTVILDASPVNYLDVTFRNELADIISELNNMGIKMLFIRASEEFENKLSKKLSGNKLTLDIFYHDI